MATDNGGGIRRAKRPWLGILLAATALCNVLALIGAIMDGKSLGIVLYSLLIPLNLTLSGYFVRRYRQHLSPF